MNMNHNEVAIECKKTKNSMINQFGQFRFNELVEKKIRDLDLNSDDARQLWDNLTVDEIKEHPIYACAVAESLNRNKDIRQYKQKERNLMDSLVASLYLGGELRL